MENKNLGQNMLERFILTLQSANIPEDSLLEIANSLFVDVVAIFQARVASIFKPKDLENWQAFLDTKPNEAEEYYTMELFYKERTGQDFTDLFVEVTNSYLTIMINVFENYQEASKKVSKLSDEQREKLQKALIEKNQVEIDNLLKEIK